MKYVAKARRDFGVVSSSTGFIKKYEIEKCNLCADNFLPRTVFERFCHGCKKMNYLDFRTGYLSWIRNFRKCYQRNFNSLIQL